MLSFILNHCTEHTINFVENLLTVTSVTDKSTFNLVLPRDHEERSLEVCDALLYRYVVLLCAVSDWILLLVNTSIYSHSFESSSNGCHYGAIFF